MRSLLAIVVPGLLLAALVGCASDPQDPGSQPAGRFAAKDQALRGQTFVSTTVTVDHEPRRLVDGTLVTIGFTDQGISLDAGCNQMSGHAAYADGYLTVDGMGGTEMGCESARMDQDAWLADFLGDDPRYVLDGDTLTLTGGRTVITLQPDTAEPSAALVGTRWRLDGIVAGSGPDATVGSPPAGVRSTLRLVSDHAFGLRTGCNTAGGAT